MINSFLDYGPPTRSSPRKQTLPAASSSDEEENVSYYSSNYENDDNVIVEDPGDEKLEEEKAIWKSTGWTIDPCDCQVLEPRLLHMEGF